MKHAIVSLAGTQFNVQENDLIQVPGNSILDPIVLFYSDGKSTQIGTPGIKDFHIKIDFVEEKNGEKVQVKRFKAKSRYKKNKGHRQKVLVLRVAELGEPKKVEEAVIADPAVKTDSKPTKPVKKVQKAEK